MAVFEKYANYYDLFYKGKDTESECDFITQSIQKYGLGTVQEILDAGCGTGRHAITLARHGRNKCRWSGFIRTYVNARFRKCRST